jgi:protein SCO1/2
MPRNLELALVEASEGKIGTLADKFTLLCYAYDPSTGHYGFYVIGALRIGAVLTLLALFTFWITHYIQVKRMAGRAPEEDAVAHPESTSQSA